MRSALVVLSLAVLALPGCTGKGDLTGTEAKEAMTETVNSGRGEAATNEVIEVSTDFTLGEALEDAAEQLRAWWASQAPCADISRDGDTVTVDFGDLTDACTYNDHTYGGIARITVARTDTSDVEVDHAWEAFTNGDVTLDGTANVTWAGGDNPSRHVVHDLTWTRQDATIEATGDRNMTLVDPTVGLSDGIQIDGSRDWTSDAGDWALDIGGVQMRAQDPIPQSGTYTLTTSAGKTMTVVFERIDADTIQATVSGVRGGDRVYLVTSTGEVSES